MKRKILIGILTFVLLLALSSVAFADHTHDYQAEIHLPTCTEKGYTVYICSCGDSYIGNEYPALGHKWDDGVITREPTCTAAGVKTFTCSRCNETRTETLPALGHKWDAGTVTKEPTCGDYGDRTFRCSTCSAVRTESIAPTGNHNYQNGVCKVCGKKNPCPSSVFQDVTRHDDTKASGYVYHDAIDWAVSIGITNGTSATTFSPNAGCTRAQAVTFMWRAVGEPAPKSAVNPFKDVKEGAYYYNAVLWAAELGITTGTTETTFSPDATCTRAQIVTFLWRALQEPVPSTKECQFKDVNQSSYYYNAVLWAVEHNVTNGTSATAFSPNATCTRAQIVTFFYRTAQDLFKD